jgi:hypothetical protein
MVTVQQLRAARPGAWRDAATGWRRLAGVLAERAGTVDAVRERLVQSWRGGAAQSAGAALRRLARVLLALRGPVLGSDQALSEHATEIERLQQRLGAVLAALGAHELAVRPDGVVEIAGPQRPEPALLALADETTQAVAVVLAAAQRTDTATAGRLRAVAAELSAVAVDLSGAAAATPAGPVDLPPPGTSPLAVRRWWDAMPASAQDLLAATRPAEVGALDGVPVAARDTANRLVLDRLIAASRPGAARTALGRLAERLAAPATQRAYLMAIDPAGDGRAVLAVGDPDHAGHVLTFVPGAATDLTGIGDLLVETDHLADAVNVPLRGTLHRAGEPAAEPTATVLWLGYDAPEWLSTSTTAPARTAAADLDRFQDGLAATAEVPGAHRTVLGHSYGSLVVGVAARDHGLAANDVILVGSPGAGVERASELGLPAGHVWASTAQADPIRLTGLPSVGGWPEPDQRWHGTAPDSEVFGARGFTSDPGSWRHPIAAHEGYFDPDGRAITAIAEITRGEYGEVR